MENIAKYIYQIYLSQSFSGAAKNLYVSQPSLSVAVSMKEKELGFKIFNRNTKPISLTREGEIYIKMLEEMFYSESLMLRRIEQLKSVKSQSITVSGGCTTSHFLLPTVCGCFSRLYPDVSISFDAGSSQSNKSFSQRLNDRETDIHFSYGYDRHNFLGYPVLEEQLAIAMHKNMVPKPLLSFAITSNELISKTYPAQKVISDISLFREVRFMDFSKEGFTKCYMSDILGYYTSSPYRVVNAKHSEIHLNMMRAGLGAILTNDYIIRMTTTPSEEILYFALPREISKRPLFAVLRKNDKPDEMILKFIEIAKEVSSNTENRSLYYK